MILSNFLSLMLECLRACSSSLFIIPLGFIVLCLVLVLFRRMGGR